MSDFLQAYLRFEEQHHEALATERALESVSVFAESITAFAMGLYADGAELLWVASRLALSSGVHRSESQAFGDARRGVTLGRWADDGGANA